jgi:hypothetical protein
LHPGDCNFVISLASVPDAFAPCSLLAFRETGWSGIMLFILIALVVFPLYLERLALLLV